MHENRLDKGSILYKRFGSGRLNFSVLIFFVCLLFTFLVWDYYFNSSAEIDRTLVSNLILGMGTLFSMSAGLFVWSLESRRDFLEKEVKKRTAELVEREKETAAAKARHEEAEKRRNEIEEAYGKLKAAQQQLIQSEKLASIGRVSASIVHELNAPLVTMKGYTKMLIMGVVKEEGESNAELIHRQAERCHKIVQALLSFSRWENPVLKHIRFSVIIEETLKNLPLEMQSSKIRITKSYEDPDLEAEADPDQMQRVFMNILINAWQAMQEYPQPFPEIKISLSKIEKMAQIVFTDRGPGMSELQMSRIFEPFYTTKPAGQGTGLGLSHSFAIVQMHGGTISVKSREGAGASFIVMLPLNKATGSNTAY